MLALKVSCVTHTHTHTHILIFLLRAVFLAFSELSTEVGLIGDEIQVNAGYVCLCNCNKFSLCQPILSLSFCSVSDISVTDLSLETHYPKVYKMEHCPIPLNFVIMTVFFLSHR